MGCENSQLVENLPVNDREAFEKIMKDQGKIQQTPQEDKQNYQRREPAPKSDGNRTVRKEKQNTSNVSQQINEQANIHKDSTTVIKGVYSSGKREGSPLSKFAVPRSNKLPDLEWRRRLDNRQLNIQVLQNQSSGIEQTKQEDGTEDLTVVIVQNTVHQQRELINENCNKECISQEMTSEQIEKSHIFAVKEKPKPLLPCDTLQQQEQCENKLQRLQVQCFVSNLMPIVETTTIKKLCIQSQHQQGSSLDLNNQHSAASSLSCEPLIIVLTQKGETLSHGC